VRKGGGDKEGTLIGLRWKFAYSYFNSPPALFCHATRRGVEELAKHKRYAAKDNLCCGREAQRFPQKRKGLPNYGTALFKFCELCLLEVFYQRVNYFEVVET
jgi:hypothetical protein